MKTGDTPVTGEISGSLQDKKEYGHCKKLKPRLARETALI
jgi:hypothetical protein